MGRNAPEMSNECSGMLRTKEMSLLRHRAPVPGPRRSRGGGGTKGEMGAPTRDTSSSQIESESVGSKIWSEVVQGVWC